MPRRKSTRLKGYDYSSVGAYFVTLCTHNRKCLFSTIVGAIHESPENKLTEYGKITTQIIEMTGRRIMVKDTDMGKQLRIEIADLENLLRAYRKGLIKEK